MNINYINKSQYIIGIIYFAFLRSQSNLKQEVASTKTKSQVTGSGRKPWQQKGTGRARAGSRRSPLFVGGGITFGPKPNKKLKKINKKELKLSIFFALYLKRKYLIKNINILYFLSMTIRNNYILIISTNLELYLRFRNYKYIHITSLYNLSLCKILKASYIFIEHLYTLTDTFRTIDTSQKLFYFSDLYSSSDENSKRSLNHFVNLI